MVYSNNIRTGNDLRIDSVNEKFGKTSLRYKASKFSICNSLPAELKELCSVNVFKIKLIFYSILCCLLTPFKLSCLNVMTN